MSPKITQEFVVNQVIKENGVTHGITTDHGTVIENFRKLFGEDATEALTTVVTHKKKDFYLIERGYQYVVRIAFQVDHGLSMQFSDFKKNIDKVLDEYLEMASKNWKKESRDKYVKIAQDIINDKRPKLAKLIVKPVHAQ